MTADPRDTLAAIQERARCPYAVQAVQIGESEACASVLVEHDVPALLAFAEAVLNLTDGPWVEPGPEGGAEMVPTDPIHALAREHLTGEDQ